MGRGGLETGPSLSATRKDSAFESATAAQAVAPLLGRGLRVGAHAIKSRVRERPKLSATNREKSTVNRNLLIFQRKIVLAVERYLFLC